MQYSNKYITKNTLTDSDIVQGFDTTGGVKTSWLNVWTNYLKTKADALYSSMTARTIKANITGSTANATNISFDQFQTALANASNINIDTNIIDLSTIDIQYVRITGLTTSLVSIANGVSGKIVNILNSTGNSIIIYNEDISQTDTNRISCSQNLTWSNNQVLTVQYNSTIQRWIVNNLSGSSYFPSLNGSTQRMIETDINGIASATHDVISSDFLNISTVTSATYINGLAVIIGTFAGQYYFDTTSNYMYTCHTDNNVNRIKIDDYLDINSIQVFGNLNISADSQLFINSQHTSTKTSQTVYSLPSVSSIGDQIFISSGIGGLGGFRINQTANQQILGNVINSTIGATGYIQSTSSVYSISLKCIEANLKWIVQSISPSVIITVV